jgi:hypothetical protein
MQIAMAHCRKILIGSEPWSDTGPDLAFLTLPPDAISSLLAFGSVFLNLDRQCDVITANAQTRPLAFRAVVGVVHERTRELEPHFEGTRLKGFNASFEVGEILRQDRSGPHDLIVIDPQPDEGYEAPTSYEGVSGGGLWQFICEEHADGTPLLVRRELIGVAFFQSPPLNGKRLITCHGPTLSTESWSGKCERSVSSKHRSGYDGRAARLLTRPSKPSGTPSAACSAGECGQNPRTRYAGGARTTSRCLQQHRRRTTLLVDHCRVASGSAPLSGQR